MAADGTGARNEGPGHRGRADDQGGEQMTSMSGREGQTALSADELALETVPLVHALVQEVSVRVPATIDREDLLSAGLVAVVDAARAYEPQHDGAFEVYATARIKVALLEVLRAAEVGGPERPTPAPLRGTGAHGPDRLTTLRDAIEELSEEHRLVVSGYFLDEQSEPALAAELGVAEAAVVQMRTEALMQLRDALRPAGQEGEAAASAAASVRHASYAAVVGRRALLRASGMSDVRMLPRGA